MALVYDKFIREITKKKTPKAEELLPIIFMLLENNMMFLEHDFRLALGNLQTLLLNYLNKYKLLLMF